MRTVGCKARVAVLSGPGRYGFTVRHLLSMDALRPSCSRSCVRIAVRP